ncbi:hypothetical protein [Amycolatopsis rubida]|uniref:pPIWI-RE three-gene island domain-containing protein n=1 Tax=Amycolatopsis rubida TaxID=112413 RepID=A0A1I6B9W1_9PSEU|nr:hypothetical protein [Amycolatopsis rubida]SFQ77726.1 hypothetical protein SAMN05421854_12478 [Amycolatopsis rubida]
MRSSRSFFRPLVEEMRRFCSADAGLLYSACAVELGLETARRLSGSLRVRDTWPLFSGHPFARWAGLTISPADEAMLRLVRQELWTLAGPTSWAEAVRGYGQLTELVRGFDNVSWSEVPNRRQVGVARERWDVYDRLLIEAAPLSGRALLPAEAGRYSFFSGRNRLTLHLPELNATVPEPHDLGAPAAGGGQPMRVTKDELKATAKAMNRLRPENWVSRLNDVWFEISDGSEFVDSEELTIEGLTHVLGIVGAGKSTLRDILAVHVARKLNGRVTVVVNDVAEALKCVERYNACLGANGHAAPVIGISGRAEHLRRLHRRKTSRGVRNLLDHQDEGFAYVSVQCLLNPILAAQGAEPVEYHAAPCESLYPPTRATPDEADIDDVEWSSARRACPLWNRCGRHEGARRLRDAAIWVATPAALVDARIPWAQNSEKVHFLEAAARRSDLIVVDEADRVQVQLDAMFAPGIVLTGQGAQSWVDNTIIHRSGEFSAHGRVQLSSQTVETWNSSMHGVGMISDQLTAKLVQDKALRRWLPARHFSSWRLMQKLIADIYGTDQSRAAERDVVTDVLDAFRGNPYGDRARPGYEVWDADRELLQQELVTLTGQLLHTRFEDFTRNETLRVYRALFGLDLATLDEATRKLRCLQFEFFLRLAALEADLATVVAMWPRVRAAMRLGFSELYRRPVAYAPMVPEAPMGNVLGFQFREDAVDGEDRVRGQLRFFLCSGVGRALLDALPRMPEIDRRPGLQVMALSGSSWAGFSTRYHLRAPVTVLIKPDSRKKQPMRDGCVFRFEPLFDGGVPLTLSGVGLDRRFEILERMTVELGRGGNDGKLGTELSEIKNRDRRRALLLVGSYEEAQFVADCLHNLHPRWKGRVLRLVSDDAEDEAHAAEVGESQGDRQARIVRRGDVETLSEIRGAEILVAPLLAVERGHNILVSQRDYAAIGTVFFLARPQPRPDDLGLTVNIVNDWLCRNESEAAEWLASAGSLDEGARKFRSESRTRWHQAMNRSYGWLALAGKGREADHSAVTWNLLVLMWQAIGRLVRGGVEARVVFVDAAFLPRCAARRAFVRSGEEAEFVPDDAASSLLVSIAEQLGRYLDPDASERGVPESEIRIADLLYRPMWTALTKCLDEAMKGCDG